MKAQLERRKKWAILCSLISPGVLLVLLVWLLPDISAMKTQEVQTVLITSSAFDPAEITISQGTTIEWENQDSAIHTVTSQTGLWDSGDIAPGTTYSRTFDSVGSYLYRCTYHSSMTGTVIVMADIYLPIVLRNFPPPPPPSPVLYDIDNQDGDGNYTVSWSAVSGATSYTLEEDDNAAFSSPSTAYSGPDTSASITGRGTATYHYRVNASNVSGSSGWSEVKSVVVDVTPPEPGHYTGNPSVSFDVTQDLRVCNYEITIPFMSGTCRLQMADCAVITNNVFSWVWDTSPFIWTDGITGTFDTSTHVTGDYVVHICGSQLYIPGEEGTWEASKAH